MKLNQFKSIQIVVEHCLPDWICKGRPPTYVSFLFLGFLMAQVSRGAKAIIITMKYGTKLFVYCLLRTLPIYSGPFRNNTLIVPVIFHPKLDPTIWLRWGQSTRLFLRMRPQRSGYVVLVK